MTPRRSLSVLAVAGLVALPLLAASPGVTAGPTAAGSVTACPAGTVLSTRTQAQRAKERSFAEAGQQDLLAAVDAASQQFAVACRPVKSPEAFPELRAIQAERGALSTGPQGFTPQGALRAAVAAKQGLSAAPVAGSKGAFTPLGTTPLIADDPDAPGVNGLGLADQAGRIDSYAYDPVNRRLFAAPGTGGVWVSTDTGKSWRSIGDSLPYQSVGAVTWSPDGAAADGTILVVSGEASAGGNVYTGLGAFYSTDSGRTWRQSQGVPDGLMGFEIEVDPTNPKVVYAATNQGLYRSADAGRTYVNVDLPTGPCAGKSSYDDICQNANWVTDVQIKVPGGVGADKSGGQVLAAVGYRAGQRPYPGTTTPQSPQNGLYRSDTGAKGTFTFLSDIYATSDADPTAFAVQKRVGRTEMGAATGPTQDHGFVYAIVEDAVLFNGGVPVLDAADPTTATGPVPSITSLNGIYVSPDFGLSWTRMADELELQAPGTNSALTGFAQTAGMFGPGIQSWYNQFIEPDPTTATATGVPTRLVFGLEEVWASRNPAGLPLDGATSQANPADFEVIGPYFAGRTCQFLDLGLPQCPTQMTAPGDLTTHPDQQAGIFIPAADGGVTLVVGNDGGSYSQTVGPGQALTRAWGRGNQAGFNANTLLPYDASAAKDGTVAFGLQDNGSGSIRPDGKVIETAGGDGFYAAIDPDDSNVQYNEVTLATMQVTTDGGKTYTDISPPVTAPMFANPFTMDPADANHLITGGPEIVERLGGPSGDWVQVYNLDNAEVTGNRMTAVELQGDNAYVGFCSTCDIANKDPAAGQIFASGLATNVGGADAPEKGTPSGWHTAAARGLPDRYITGIAADPANPRTVYVTLAGYANRQWWPQGSFNDKNPNVGEGHVFKSTDAGDSFTDITGSLPDVPARSLELRKGQLLVGTDVGLFLSSDTKGTTWAALAGLPNVPVVSVKNMPGAPDEVVLATFGRGIYSYSFTGQTAVPPPARPGTGAGPGTTPPAAAPRGGGLATTGLPVGVAVLGLLALGTGLVLRRGRQLG